MKESDNNKVFKFILYGIAVGAILSLIYIVLELSISNLPFSFSSYLKLRAGNINAYFIDILPIPVFILIAYIVGVNFLGIEKKRVRSQAESESRAQVVLESVEYIREGKTELTGKFSEEDVGIKVALQDLQAELQERTDKERKRQEEDDRRNWISEGLANFGAILRENSDNIEKLSDSICSEMVKYIGAVQAGFFVVRDEDTSVKEPVIEHIASFAYGRKKFTDKKIMWGEGLIGACIIEKESIHLDKVTESYMEVTSGLGKANPESILIVPFKTEEQNVLGAIELASFENYPEHVIDFVEQVAESIATTITTLKVNMRTTGLLDESREQAKELSKQDERMRKTVDEMKDLQKEAALQSEEFISFTNSVNHTMIRAEYGISGKLLYANTKFLDILGYDSNSEVEGKHIKEFIHEKDRGWFEKIWERLISGGKHFEGDMKHLTKDEAEVWTISTYVSVRDRNGEAEKILFLGIDTTEQKQQSLNYEGQINALNQSSLKVELLPIGKILRVNERFTSFLLSVPDEIVGQRLVDFLHESDKEDFTEIWSTVIEGKPMESTLTFVDDDYNKVWAYGTFSIVRDMYDNISTVIFIGSDITEQHKIEIKSREQTRQLKEQEQKLQDAKVDLSKKLKQSRDEMKQQFREIETVKLLNEKTLEGMLDAIVTINQDNQLEFFNKAAEELWGVGKDVVLDNEVNVLFSEDDDDFEGEHLKKYFNVDLKNILLNTRKEVYIINAQGEQVFILMTLSEAGIGLRYRLTAFIQRIEVELF
ncbi:MAG: PAS domain-containing protein [Bacteroidota bacterium]|nr:PAS domain-containing protein [Bacteroidota bacterium]